MSAMENKDMKTKEEILDKYSNYATIGRVSCYAVEYTDAVKAMQEFSDQENARLTAINKCQTELIKHLRYQPQTSNSNNTYILYWKVTAKLESEIAELEKREGQSDKPKPLAMTVNEYYKIK